MWDQGLGDLGATAAALWLQGALRTWILNVKVGTVKLLVTLPAANRPDDPYDFLWSAAGTNGNFPYGYPVSANGPV